MIKKLAVKINILAIACCLLLGSCEGVFVPDPVDPRMPRYTDSGNNVAGAYINGNVWSSKVFFGIVGSSNQPFINYYPTADSVSITFIGAMKDDAYATISFGIKGLKIFMLRDMTKLDNKDFNLGTANFGGYYSLYDDCPVSGMGQLHCRSVKYNADREFIQFSGTFGFNNKDGSCEDQKVSSGRFDYTF